MKIKRIYTVNKNWKPVIRHSQFNIVFKNAMFGFARNWKVAKVRYLRHSRAKTFNYFESRYVFGKNNDREMKIWIKERQIFKSLLRQGNN